jgi:phosphoribosyl 1,2-cyclic phosphodiesterase
MKMKVLASGSSGNCYFLQNQNETLIIECGIPYKDILKGLDFNISNALGCLVTHEHKDHAKAIRDIIKAGIDIYTSSGTASACAVFEYRVEHIKSEKQFSLGDFKILPFEIEHDALEPLGFLIQRNDFGKLLFITDSYYCQYKFSGLNHIMIECNFSSEILQESQAPAYHKNRLLKSHFSLENVKDFLRANDLREVKNITLLHLSNGNSDAKLFKEEIEKLTGIPTYIAVSGLEIEL